jgi:hypothetical protein
MFKTQKAYKLVQNNDGIYVSFYRSAQIIKYTPNKWTYAPKNMVKETGFNNPLMEAQLDLFIFFDLDLWKTCPYWSIYPNLEIWEIEYKGYSKCPIEHWPKNCIHMAKAVKLIRRIYDHKG